MTFLSIITVLTFFILEHSLTGNTVILITVTHLKLSSNYDIGKYIFRTYTAYILANGKISCSPKV